MPHFYIFVKIIVTIISTPNHAAHAVWGYC